MNEPFWQTAATYSNSPNTPREGGRREPSLPFLLSSHHLLPYNRSFRWPSPLCWRASEQSIQFVVRRARMMGGGGMMGSGMMWGMGIAHLLLLLVVLLLIAALIKFLFFR